MAVEVDIVLVEGPEVVADGALARRLVVRAEGPKIRVGKDGATGKRDLKAGKPVERVTLGALATAASRFLGAFLGIPKFRVGKLTASFGFAVYQLPVRGKRFVGVGRKKISEIVVQQ